jgi:hypothetical protein
MLRLAAQSVRSCRLEVGHHLEAHEESPHRCGVQEQVEVGGVKTLLTQRLSSGAVEEPMMQGIGLGAALDAYGRHIISCIVQAL